MRLYLQIVVAINNTQATKNTHINQVYFSLILLEKVKVMPEKNKKQFGIWMDSHQAIIVGRENISTGKFIALAS